MKIISYVGKSACILCKNQFTLQGNKAPVMTLPLEVNAVLLFLGLEHEAPDTSAPH